MVTDSVKKVLVLSDNAGLARAIAVNLKCQDREIITIVPSFQNQRKDQPANGQLDLIVVAMSLRKSEPLAALARASLGSEIGQVPLLIISNSPFQTVPGERITHLEFPFEVDGLEEKVSELLQKEKAT